MEDILKVEDIKEELESITTQEVLDFIKDEKNIAYSTVEDFILPHNIVEKPIKSFCKYAQLIVCYNKEEKEAKKLGVELLNKFLTDLIVHKAIFKILGVGMMDILGQDTLRGTYINRNGSEAVVAPPPLNHPVDYICESEYQKHRKLFFFFFHPTPGFYGTEDNQQALDALNSWCDKNNHPFKFCREGEISGKEVVIFK